MIPTGYLRFPTLLAAMVLASVLVLLVVGPASTARADTTFTVKSSADTDGSTCGAADCTLRQAINAANAASGNDTIGFDVGQTATKITLGSRLPAITDASGLTIDGGSASITVSGNKQGGVLGVLGRSARLALKNLTVADGFVTGSTVGGGLYNDGTLEVTDSTFSGNSAPVGAAIVNGGTLTVTNSTFSDNSADFQGGGIWNFRGALTVINSTFSGNSAIQGSGIWSGPPGEGALTVTNSTISQNIMRSHDAAHGGGIYSANEGSLKNTIVANNSGENCFGTLTDGGYNISSDASCNLTAPTSRTTTDPMLDPLGLRDNGGPTKTIALQQGSPAIDKGNSFGATTDQRGVSRPQGVAADIGAYEQVDITAPTVTSTVPENNPTTKVLKTADVTATFSEDVQNVNTTTFKLERVIAAKKSPTKYEPVAATVTPSSGIVEHDANATLNPTQDLPNGTYRVTLTDGVIDTAGNALVPKTWTFKVSK